MWTALGVLAFPLFGLLGGLAIRQLHAKAKQAAMVAAAPAAADFLIEGPLLGDVAGTLYFGSGQACLPDDAAAAVSTIKAGKARACAARPHPVGQRLHALARSSDSVLAG